MINNGINPFKIGFTRDFLTPDGRLVYEDIGISEIELNSAIQYEFFEKHEATVQASQLQSYDAVISLTPRYVRQSFDSVERLLAIFRFGVGYDMVDVQACTDAGIALCITAGAVNYSVAEATVAWMLALCHRVTQKDHLIREGGWQRRNEYMGSELRDRKLGIIGMGGIGSQLVELLRTFRMQVPMVFDPYLSPKRAKELGVNLVSLAQLMRESDFISVNCPLTENTRNLVGRDLLQSMKSTAYLINTARGGIVDEAALVDILQNQRIAGAAIDVFESEPISEGHPFLQMDNVLLAPHCIAWTDELFRDMGHMACRQAATIASGEIPSGVVNPEVLQNPIFKNKLTRLKNEKL